MTRPPKPRRAQTLPETGGGREYRERGISFSGMIRFTRHSSKVPSPIEGSKKGPHKAVAFYLPSSARSMLACSGDRDGGVRSWRRGWRAGCALARWLGGWRGKSFLCCDGSQIYCTASLQRVRGQCAFDSTISPCGQEFGNPHL
jgi:hypothetical protein